MRYLKIPFVNSRNITSIGKSPKNWKKTLHLPASVLNVHGFGNKADKTENTLITNWNQHYEAQRDRSSTGMTFWLHDGPPYANGDLHAGHALNKLLKDMVVRHRLMKGERVLYRPGWDCHGLPIELTVQKSKFQSKMQALDIRMACRKWALSTSQTQLDQFKSWGVIGDWSNPYRTMDMDYQLAELNLFTELAARNLVVRNMQPVYWSPTSGTAIAESELEYNNAHQSLSAFIAFKLAHGKHEYAAVWTTTIWSIPGNEAVAFSPKLDYSWYIDEVSCNRYIIADLASDRVSSALGRPLKRQENISAADLINISYHHPFLYGKTCPFVMSNHVTAELGSGLVHTAPVYGHEDWELGVKFNLPIRVTIDDAGRFTEAAGNPALTGKYALNKSEGIDAVLRCLGKNDIGVHVISSQQITHSYPYDWRTKAPVMIRASKQWFIDLRNIRETALRTLAHVDIQPDSLRYEFARMLSSRDFWCISRQRVWGVPIPVLYINDNPLLNVEVLRGVIDTFKSRNSTDCWWQLPAEEFMRGGKNVEKGDLSKGKDILDVWFDSGASWHCVKATKHDSPAISDCYVEGVDQFRGWFLSSLLLSVATGEQAPYKRLLWHGFVVDDNGKKMSKSIGNVVDPKECIQGSSKRQLPAVGLDGLRLWAARSQSESQVKLGQSSLNDCRQMLVRFRNSYSFLLGNMKATSFDPVDFKELTLIDQFILHKLYTLVADVRHSFDSFNFRRGVNLLDRFFTEMSQWYFTVIKDRLYCDRVNSMRRRSCLTTLQILTYQLATLSFPLTPFTSEEIFNRVKSDSSMTLLSKGYGDLNEYVKWQKNELGDIFESLFEIRALWLQIAAPTDATNYRLQLSFAEQSLLVDIEKLLPNKVGIEQLFTEVFHVSSCAIAKFNAKESGQRSEAFRYQKQEQNFNVKWEEIDSSTKCSRCRRYTCDAKHSTELCQRCLDCLPIRDT